MGSGDRYTDALGRVQGQGVFLFCGLGEKPWDRLWGELGHSLSEVSTNVSAGLIWEWSD